MNGTSAPHTRAMLRTPPITTTAVSSAVAMPTHTGEMA